MAKTRQQKEEELKALEEKFSKSKGTVLTHFMGLTVAELQELRRKLRAEKSELVVAKKNLISLLFGKKGFEKEGVQKMEGDVAVAFGYEDEIAPAKVLGEFGKSHPAIQFHGGVLEGKFLSAAEVQVLSTIPSRKELLGKMVGSLGSPLAGLMNVLQGHLRGFVQVLSQIKDQKK